VGGVVEGSWRPQFPIAVSVLSEAQRRKEVDEMLDRLCRGSFDRRV
jgi:hypothetical protein